MERMSQTKEFNELLERYGPIVNKVCYFYAADVDNFNDLRQEALINLWRATDCVPPEAARSTWVYRIALNSCVSYFRKTRRHLGAEPIENHPELITDDDARAELLREMYAMINLLGDVDKAIILMWLDGYEYDAIAEVVGMGKGTVGTRIYRIKQQLQRMADK